MVLPVQGWNFSSLMCTTQRLWLICLFAPSLRATSTESFRGGYWLFAWPPLATSDVIPDSTYFTASLKRYLSSKLNLFFSVGPSSCEEERRAAIEALSVYIPSCEPGGNFSPRQCQQGGQCWCVDPSGQDRPSSRRQGDVLDCSECPQAAAALVLVVSTWSVEPPTPPPCCFSHPSDLGPDSCLWIRRHALLHLLSAPAPTPLQSSSLGNSQSSCSSLLQTLGDLLPVEGQLHPFLSYLVEVLGGLFHTVGEALQALSNTSHRRLQENLFGGKFLSKLSSSNLSGLVGTRGPFVLDWLSGKRGSIQENQDLVESVSRVLGDQAFLLGLQVVLAGHSRLLPPGQVKRKRVWR